MSIDPAGNQHPAAKRYAASDQAALTRRGDAGTPSAAVHGEVEPTADPAVLRRRISAERADLVRTVEQLAVRLDVKSRLRQRRAEVRETAKVRLRILGRITLRVLRSTVAALLDGVAALAQFAADLLSGRVRVQRALPPGPSLRALPGRGPYAPERGYGSETYLGERQAGADYSGRRRYGDESGRRSGSGDPYVAASHSGERSYDQEPKTAEIAREPGYGASSYEDERRYRGQEYESQHRETIPGAHPYDRAG